MGRNIMYDTLKDTDSEVYGNKYLTIYKYEDGSYGRFSDDTLRNARMFTFTSYIFKINVWPHK